jgi:hypothetical protein
MDANDTSEKINKLYKNLTYFDIYSGSVFLFVVLMVVLICVHYYFVAMKNAEYIKTNWSSERCKPQNIMFAGMINKPINSSVLNFTEENFNYCIQNIVSSISSYALDPFNYIFQTLIVIFKDINESVQAIRNLISNIRNNITNIIQEIMGKVLNIITPIQVMFISVMDSFNKTQGVLMAGLMTALGSYYTLQSLVGAILEFIIKILVVMAILIVALWAGLFTWPVAAATSAIFVAISIPLVIIIVFMTVLLKVHPSGVIPHLPSKPKCFDASTFLKLKNGKYVFIKNIKLDEILEDNSKVTAIVKVSSHNETLYSLNGVIVSGSHFVLFNQKWIKVKNHPSSLLITDYHPSYLYCINTTSKLIKINNLTFCDWDELYDDREKNIVLNTKYDDNNKIEQVENINKYLDKGFKKDSNVLMFNNQSKKIKDVGIGDILLNGDYVYGIVKICNKNMNVLEKEKYFALYSLLTDSGYFNINGIEYSDYNNCIEKFLQ